MTSVVLITGASRGIGAATARLAAERGDHVAVNYTRNADAVQAVVAECVALGARAIAVQADVADEAAVIAMFDTVADELGPVGVLVNNAGILHTQMRFDEMSVDRWRALLDVNVIGAFVCAREAVRRMSTRHGGRGAPSSTCRRRRAIWAAQGSTSTTPRARQRSTRSPSDWARRSRPKASGSTPCALG
jgi:NAD(P)-dependent dehydrogenase (short-subunit alcohol dehydrogenase family)